MLIVGAKGFAKEVLEIFVQKNETQGLFFFDDVNQSDPDILYSEFPVIKNVEDVPSYFDKDKRYTLGIGKPKLRKMLADRFDGLGGEFTTVISAQAEIGSFGIIIEEGSIILSGVKVSNDVKIGRGTMIYYNSVITHDVSIGRFCEISPSVSILGRAVIGDFVSIGAGSVIFPDVVIGDNSIIAAGSVVRENVPANCMVAGVPALFKKNLE